MQVLDQPGPVEAVLAIPGRYGRGARLRSQDVNCRRWVDLVEQEEYEDRYAEYDHDRRADPAYQVGGHRRSLPSGASQRGQTGPAPPLPLIRRIGTSIVVVFGVSIFI